MVDEPQNIVAQATDSCLCDRKIQNEEEILKRIDATVLRECINEYYTEPLGVVYRFSHSPLDEHDKIPQKLRRKEDDIEDVPDKLGRYTSKEELKEFMDGVSLSAYDTEEHAKQALVVMYDSRKEKSNEKEAHKLIRRVGEYIVKVDFQKEDGFATPPDEKGHLEVLLFEDIDIEKRLDLDFGYKEALL